MKKTLSTLKKALASAGQTAVCCSRQHDKLTFAGIVSAWIIRGKDYNVVNLGIPEDKWMSSGASCDEMLAAYEFVTAKAAESLVAFGFTPSSIVKFEFDINGNLFTCGGGGQLIVESV